MKYADYVYPLGVGREGTWPPRIGSLFSGYGGLDMGVQAALGGSVAWHVEYDKAPSKILAHHWPTTPNYGDVTAVDWSAVEPVDIIAGGFPCTDISSSGMKAGIDDGINSGLWREMARAIGALRPGLVVVENVRDLLSRGLARVVGDLADLGYDARWTTISACAVGAPFARVRLFIAATPTGADFGRLPRVAQHDRIPQQAAPIWEGWKWKHADRLALGDKRLLDRWAATLGRPAPDPYDTGTNGQPRLTPEFNEWLMGLAEGHVTSVDIPRQAKLKALGNGVVPQQAEAALRFLLSAEAVAA